MKTTAPTHTEYQLRLPLPPLSFQRSFELELARELFLLGTRASSPITLLLGTMLLCLLTWRHAEMHTLVTLVAIAFIATSLGMLIRLLYPRQRIVSMTGGELWRAEQLSLVFYTVSGISVGSCSQLLVASELVHTIIIVFFYTCSIAIAGAAVILDSRRIIGTTLGAAFTFMAPLPFSFPEDWMLLIAGLVGFHTILSIASAYRISTLIEVLRLRNAQKQLLQQQLLETARANKANNDKSAFLAAASHDLRQPLHALLLTSHSLSMRTPDGEDRVMVDRILEAGRALSSQFNHLMDLSKLESGTYRFNPANVLLVPLLQQVLAAQRETADHKGVALKLAINPRLRTAALFTDAGLLQRTLGNLLDNAVKFSNPKQRILLSARLRGNHIVLGVHDQGAGIPPEQHENIFKPYVQLGNPTRDMRHGIGLGLSIVQGAATMLGARLSLRSAIGRGSHFTLLLPGEARPAAPPPESRSPTTAAEILIGKRLLLVEDDPMAAAAVVAWAEHCGLKVTHHLDPREVRADPVPDLILSDVRLPGDRNGISWLSEWLGLWPDACGLLVSGELAPETHRQAEQEGLLLLTKPVMPETLLRTLASMLHGRSAHS